jgi:polyisoprenoid-binding protein YceI
MLRRTVGMIFLFLSLAYLGNAQTRIVDGLRGESTMTYRIVHPLHKIEAASKDVEYRIAIDMATKAIMNVSAHVDVTSFNSGNSSRDSHAMEVIDALTYPEASFKSAAIATAGDSLTVTGLLTFHGVAKDVVIHAKAAWSAQRLQVDGAFDISLTAFSIERPSLLLIPVEDALRFSFTAVFPLE